MRIYNLLMALLLAIASTACYKKSTGSTDEHAHDESIRLTGYSANFEIFAEATPFVVGQPGEILAHFTHLDNFKPLTSGSVTASLIVGTDGVRQQLTSPLRDGIYKFTIKPVSTGTGKLVFDITTESGNSQVTIPNIQVFSNEHDAQHAAIDAVASSNNGVLFTKEQSWKVDFATEEVKHDTFGPIIRTIAQIEPSRTDEKIIVAKTGGIVRFSNQDIVSGKAVKAGQLLFTIESGGLADNNIEVRLVAASVEYKRARAEWERKSALAQERVVSERELLEAEANFKNAETLLTNLQANFSNGRQPIASPISGYVNQVLVRNGEFVETGQPVAIVSQNQGLMLKAEVQSKFFPVLDKINSANIRILNSNKTYTLEELQGKLLSFGKSTNLNNPLIPVVFQVQNNGELLPGGFVEMFIMTQTSELALTVPNKALIEEMGAYFVFVQVTPEFFEKRPVTIGKTDGFRTEIKSGLAASERVVSRGAILVKLSQVTGSLDAHGHAH